MSAVISLDLKRVLCQVAGVRRASRVVALLGPEHSAMRSHELSAEVRLFVAKYVWTFEELRILTVFRAGDDANLSQIENQLGVSSFQARHAVEALCTRGLLERRGNDSFRVQAQAEIRAAVLQVVSLCDADPAALVQLLSANALGRVRAAAHATFRRRGGKA